MVVLPHVTAGRKSAGRGAIMAERFRGMVILVAGGTGGLGRATSLAFLKEGATVAVTYRKEAEFVSLQRLAGKYSSSLEGHLADVTNQDQVQQVVKSLLAARSRLDVLVNAVGAYAGGTKLWETDVKVFELMMDLNLRSGFLLSRVVVPVMLKQGKGSIVNVASQAAVDHATGASAYAASKAGALAMIDSLAADLRGTGVRANTILPSIIDTEANRKAIPSADFSKWPKPEDIAQVILFLCSDEATLVHGAAVPVYGNS